MTPPTRMRGTTRLAHWTCAALIAFSLASLGGYWASRLASFTQLEQATLDTLANRTATLTSAIAEQTRSVIYNLDLSLHHLQREYAERGRIAEADAQAVLGATPPGLVRRIAIIDATGHLVRTFPSLPPAAGPSAWLGDRPHFRAHGSTADDKLFIGHPIESRISRGEWLIPMSRALRDAGGGFAGVVVLSVAPEYFAGIYARFANGRDDVIALVLTDGTFLSRNLNLHDHLGKAVRADRPFVGEHAARSGVFRSRSSHEPVDRVFAFRRLDEWPLVVVNGVGVEEALDSIRASREENLRAMLAISALVVFLVTGVCGVLLRLERNYVRLRDTEERLELAFSGASELAWEWDVSRHQIRFFGDCQAFVGQDVRDARVGIEDWTNRIHPDDRDAVRKQTMQALRGGADGFELEYRLQHADGDWRWVLVRGRTVARSPAGHTGRMIGVLMDIDRGKKADLLAAQTRESYARLIENVGEGIFVVDRDGRIEILNPAAERLLGWSADEAHGHFAHDLFHRPAVGEEHVDWPACPLAQTLQDGAPRRGERMNYRRKDGTSTPVELSIAPVMLGGRPAGAVVVITDIAARLAWEAELERLARTDMLTGVFNRRYFVELAEREIHRSERDSAPLSLLMLDLDHFKSVNDRYGHAAGDAVLAATAGCCQEELRQIDVLGRLGGEEFGVVLPAVGANEALLVAERLRKRIAGLEVVVNQQLIRCTVSIGIAERRPAESLDSVLARADRHMYAAKGAGRNRVLAEPPALT